MTHQHTIVLLPAKQARTLAAKDEFAIDEEVERLLALHEDQYDYYQLGEEAGYSLDSSSSDVWPATDPPDPIEFEAIITPDGTWHETDWALETPWEVWEACVKALLAEHANCLAFTVYMHV